MWQPVCPGRLCAEAAASPKKSPSSLSAPIWRARFFPSQRKPLCSASTARAFLPATNCLPSRSSSFAGPSAIKKLGEDSGVYAYGVAFPEHVANFWDMVFPPTSARDQELGLLTLICNVCQSVDRSTTPAWKRICAQPTMASSAIASAAASLFQRDSPIAEGIRMLCDGLRRAGSADG